jgi:hypothetical protein
VTGGVTAELDIEEETRRKSVPDRAPNIGRRKAQNILVIVRKIECYDLNVFPKVHVLKT